MQMFERGFQSMGYVCGRLSMKLVVMLVRELTSGGCVLKRG